MSNVSLDKFTSIGRDFQVGRNEQNEPKPVEKGNFFGRLFSVRSHDEKLQNIEITKEFRQALVEKYGERVTQWAFSDIEGRLTSGQPLSGRRIEQIVALAESARAKDVEALNRLVGERAPLLLDQALERAGVQIPDGVSGSLRRLLEGEIKEGIRHSDKFREPSLLQTHVFNEEFKDVVDGIVAKYRDAIPHVGEFEQRQSELREQIRAGNAPLPESEDGFTWGKAPPKDVERCFSQALSLREFLRGFGEGDGKVGNIDDYFSQKVLPEARKKFEGNFGVRNEQKMESYEGFKGGTVNNGSFSVSKEGNRPFYDVMHMSLGQGEQGGMTRDEKFHISVPPEHLKAAFERIAPILMREDCPFKLWKMVDVDRAIAGYQECKAKLDNLDSEVKKLKDGGAAPETIKRYIEKLEENAREAKRLVDSCQFTLYMSNGRDTDGKSVGQPQGGGDFSGILSEIEQALSEAGIPTVGTPGSDEPVGRYVSFRMERVILNPGDPGYDEARLSQGVPEGRPVEVEMDRFNPDEDSKAKFRDSPDFQPQLGLSRDLYTEDTRRLRQSLNTTGVPGSNDERLAFLKLAGEVNQLGKSVDRLEGSLSGKDWDDLKGGKTGLQSQLRQRLDGELGITEETQPGGLTKFSEALPEFGELMLEFSRPGRQEDPGMLDRLQGAMVRLDEIGRDLRGQEPPPYLEFVRGEMTRMLDTCHEGLGTPSTLRVVSDGSRALSKDAPIHESMRRAMEQVEQSNLDDGAKREMLGVLALAGRLISASSDPDLAIEVRLRMAGEIESLGDELSDLLSGQRDKVDGPGQRTVQDLRQVAFKPDLTGIVDQFRQIDGSPVPGGHEAWSEDFRRLGVALEQMDRGLPLLDEEVPELRELLESMDTFFDGTYQPTPQFRPMSDRLRAEVERLREFVG